MSAPDLLRTRELEAQDATARRLSRAAARGILARIRRGAYVEREAWERASPAERLLVRITALHDAAPGVVFSHESAALLHDMPIIGDWPELPHVTVPRGVGKTNAVTRRTERALPEAMLAERDGFRLTGPVRTVVDVAATRTVLAGAVAISDARHRLGVVPEEVLDEIARCRPFRSVRRVERALDLSSALSESPLETLVAVRCADLGFAPPEQQRVVPLAGGRVARVDFAWDDGAVLLEADGAAKYLDAELRAGRTAAEVVVEEKRREDELRDRSRAFLRVDWAGAWSGTGLERKLLRAGVPRVARAGPLTF